MVLSAGYTRMYFKNTKACIAKNANGARPTGRPESLPSVPHRDSRCQCIGTVFDLFLARIGATRPHAHAKASRPPTFT